MIMNKISIFTGILSGLILISTTTIGQTISDISKKDGSYSEINASIKNGYLSLFSDNSFKPNAPLSRREAALIIHRLIKNTQNSGNTFTKAEIQELGHLSKSYKNEFSTLLDNINTYIATQENHEKEIETLHLDLSTSFSTLSAENKKLKNELNTLKTQRKYTWTAIAVAALLGISR